MNPWLFLIPVISALIGFLSVRLAGSIFFRKILPARQQHLADRVGEAVHSQISFIQIRESLNDPANSKAIIPVVETHIDDFLRNKLKEKMPMIGMLIGDKTIQSLKEVFLKEIEDMFPAIINQFAGTMEKKINVKEIVSKKIASIPLTKIERAFSPVQRLFEYAALVGGVVSGLIAILLFYLL